MCTPVAALQQELHEAHRTELPGIGVFRRVAGRGLAFEYTGTDNLLPAAYGLPTLAARPVRATDAQAQRQKQRPRPQPALRSSTGRQLARVLPGAAAVLGALALVVAVGFYFTSLSGRSLLTAWQARLPRWEVAQAPSQMPAPQQAALAHHEWNGAEDSRPMASPGRPAAETPVPAVPTDSVATGTATAADFPAPTQVAAAAESPNSAALPVEPAADANPVAPATARPATVAGLKNVPARDVAMNAPAVALVKPATAIGTTIKARTGRYFVIAGAYSNLANAEVGRKVLARTGHPARVILPFYGSRLFRLTAGDFATAAEAETEAQRLRQTTHCDYNTLKF